MTASDVINSVINAGAAPVLKAGGFRKSNWNFHRRKGSIVQVVNFQRGYENRGDDGIFYVNIGIAFDELWQLQGLELTGYARKVMERPLEHQCHFRSRLENLVLDCPRWWVVAGNQSSAQFFREVSSVSEREIITSDAETDRVATYLANSIERAVTELDKIDSPKSFLSHPWKNTPGNGAVSKYLSSLT